MLIATYTTALRIYRLVEGISLLIYYHLLIFRLRQYTILTNLVLRDRLDFERTQVMPESKFVFDVMVKYGKKCVSILNVIYSFYSSHLSCVSVSREIQVNIVLDICV